MSPLPRTPGHRLVSIATVIAAVSPLVAGCATFHTPVRPAPSSGPRSVATIERAVDAVPGARFTAARAWDGTTGYVTASLTITDTFHGDRAELVDYTLAQLASQTELTRGRFVRFTSTAPELTVDDTQALLSKLHIESDQYADGSSLELSNRDLDKRYGPWPAPAPKLPASLAVKGSK